ncbi:hypothetical protein N8I77_006745 [Diaporthe amygdali]|uniref:Amine oxidase domain-containing protein n=1 Tax=Phomopsis amygdali TaxID=1214568 RepID=A0AAD9SH96_PHOAM|nr:hypothetical protein N8I77_006745 [Diaporthe amygdali]
MSTTKSSAKPRVCVVGAGISGLRAAGLLASGGCEVSIFEARHRIGGRVHQSTQLGGLVDIGASWIHGTEGNPFVELAEKSGTATVACGAVYSMFDMQGRYMERSLAKDLYEKAWAILDEASEYSKTQGLNIHPGASLKAFVGAKLNESDDEELLLASIIEMWGAFMGADYETQSLKNLWLDESVDGDNLFVASTFKRLVKDLAEDAVSRSDLHLNTEVILVKNAESLMNKASEHQVWVTTRDGRTHAFDQVIITAPLGWLKHNRQIFSPALPPRLSQAIDSIGYGNLEKIFIRFPKAFWDDVGRAPGQITFPIESLFLQPKYAPETNPNGWRQEIISLSGLPEPHAQPVIMFFTYGEWGRHISSLISGYNKKSSEYHEILDSHFRPYYSRLPQYNAESPDCNPIGFLSTDWQNDQFAGFGSFTNFPLGQGNGAEDLEALRQGIGRERGVWFAGEHVAPYKGIGTVLGAYQSGEYVTKEIIKSLNKDKEEETV